MARILLVEDQHNIRLLIATLLRSSGHEIVEADDGEEAHSILKNPPAFDMLITDLQLPRLDGTQLIQHARSDNPKLIILAVSAYHDRLAEAQARGADRTLSKPFSHRQLMDTVSSMVELLPD